MLAIGNKVLLEKTIDISPEDPFFEETKLPAGVSENDLRLSLLSVSGESLISYKPAMPKGDPMPEPVKPPPAPEKIGTVDELYHTGLRLEQFLNQLLL